MHDTQATAEKIVCLVTGENTISALEPMGKELPEVIVEKSVVLW